MIGLALVAGLVVVAAEGGDGVDEVDGVELSAPAEPASWSDALAVDPDFVFRRHILLDARQIRTGVEMRTDLWQNNGPPDASGVVRVEFSAAWGPVAFATNIPLSIDDPGGGALMLHGQLRLLNSTTERLAVFGEVGLPTARGRAGSGITLPQDVRSLARRTTSVTAGAIYERMFGRFCVTTSVGGEGGRSTNDPLNPKSFGAGWLDGSIALPMSATTVGEGGGMLVAFAPQIEAEAYMFGEEAGVTFAPTMTFGASAEIGFFEAGENLGILGWVGAGYQVPLGSAGVTQVRTKGRFILTVSLAFAMFAMPPGIAE